MILRWICGALMSAVSVAVLADICLWTDATGAAHYGDHAPPDATAKCVPAPANKTTPPQSKPYQLDPEIAKIAKDIERAERANAPLIAEQAAAQARFEATLGRARWLIRHPAP